MGTIMPQAHKISDNCTVRFTKGSKILDYNETWQVVHDDPFRNSVDVFKVTSGLPQVGLIYLVGGFTVLCIDCRPTKVSDDHKSLWQFEMRFTNDPSVIGEQNDQQGNPNPYDPTKWAKEVDISFDKEYVPVTDAVFKEIQDKDGVIRQAPDWLVDYVGPVIDSATTAKLVEKPKSVQTIRVSRWVNQFDPLWDFHDTINKRPVRISDGFGVSERYPSRTLRFDRVTKQDMWTDNGRGGQKKVYKETIELSHNPDEWYHKEVDAGTEQLARVGKTYNPASNKLYTQDEVNELAGVEKDANGNWKTNPSQAIVGITSDQGDGVKVAVGSPVPLNSFGTVAEGNGNILELMPFNLVYELYEEKDFSPLNL